MNFLTSSSSCLVGAKMCHDIVSWR